ISKVWGGLRALIVSAAGEVMASSEGEARGSLALVPAVRGALAGRPFEGVLRLGAEEARPSYAVVEPVTLDGAVVGAVLAAFLFDADWVQAAERRHGLDLSLRIGPTLVSKLESAGGGEPASAPGRGALRRVGGRLLAAS